MANIVKGKIGNALMSVAPDGIVATADAIYDETKGKSQEQINEDTKQLLAEQANNIGYYECDTAATTAAKEITGGSYKLPAAAPYGGALKVKFTHKNSAANPTLSINQSTPKPLYYNGAIASSTNTWEDGDVLDLYYDGINFNARSVVEKFATGEKVKNVSIDDEPTAGSNNLVKSGGVQNELALGAVYDVSAKNPTAGPNNDDKWESLSALLSDANLNTLIPTSVRKGGMSIKFVQSSDNKYVQFFCTADEFTTDVTKWHSIYDEVDKVINDIQYNKNCIDDITIPNTSKETYYKEIHNIADNIGGVDKDGNFIPSATGALAYTIKIPVSEGEILKSNGIDNTIRFVCAYNGDSIVPSKGSNSTSLTEYVVPSGITNVVLTLYPNTPNDLDTMPGILVYKYGKFIKTDTTFEDEDLPANSKAVGNLTKNVEKVDTIIKSVTPIAVGYMDVNGTVYPSSGGLCYTDKLAVNVGDVITSNGNDNMLRVVTALGNDEVAISDKGVVSAYEYEVPDGVAFVILSLYLNTPNDLTSCPTINVQSTTTKKSASIIDYSNSLPKSLIKKGDISSGTVWELEENNIKIEKIISFSGTLGTLSSILIGHGKTRDYIKIDSTNIYHYSLGSLVNTYPHGLTIENNLQVNIIVGSEPNYHAKVVLVSSGNEYDCTINEWFGNQGKIFVESVGSSLTDCALSFICRNYISKVFAFGDSYFGHADDSRWCYYLLTDGYNDVMLDGFGGRESYKALQSFKNDIKHGIPSYVFWALGMNDIEDGAMNVTWENCVEEVLSKCDQYDIEVVLATIPNTPTMNNTYKNEYVRNSGRRYVDFAAAVGASTSGSSWYNGMLSVDNVHPTALGAQALYRQVLADFPEITLK